MSWLWAKIKWKKSIVYLQLPFLVQVYLQKNHYCIQISHQNIVSIVSPLLNWIIKKSSESLCVESLGLISMRIVSVIKRIITPQVYMYLLGWFWENLRKPGQMLKSWPNLSQCFLPFKINHQISLLAILHIYRSDKINNLTEICAVFCVCMCFEPHFRRTSCTHSFFSVVLRVHQQHLKSAQFSCRHFEC